MKKLEEIIRGTNLYFGAEIYGSYILYRAELIDINQVNNLNLIVKSSNITGIRAYLVDQGFKEIIDETPSRGSASIKLVNTGVFKSEGMLDIKVSADDKLNILGINGLLGKKIAGGTKSDLEVVKTAVDKLLKNIELGEGRQK